jgi:DNA invertase Pin-like site-specific DNA recombinase
MRTALYARVSTSDQRPEVQLAPLRAWAAARGADVLEYVDHGVSGRRDRRPALDELLGAIRRREVGSVVVTKLDRLARSVRHLTHLAAELEALGVALVVLDQSIDTSSSAGRLLFHVLGAIGEFEAELCRERTRAGLAAARRRGVKLGRRPALDAERIARARRMRGAGRSLREIGRVLGCSTTAVLRAIAS